MTINTKSLNQQLIAIWRRRPEQELVSRVGQSHVAIAQCGIQSVRDAGIINLGEGSRHGDSGGAGTGLEGFDEGSSRGFADLDQGLNGCTTPIGLGQACYQGWNCRLTDRGERRSGRFVAGLYGRNQGLNGPAVVHLAQSVSRGFTNLRVIIFQYDDQ